MSKSAVLALQIDRDAAAILNSSVRAVQAILARRERLDLEGKPDKTLVVLAGECHTMPSNILHHMKVMEGLKRAGQDFSAAWETDHNNLSQSFFAQTNREYDPAVATAIEKEDADGNLGLKILMYAETGGASHARKALIHYLLNEDIATICNDAAHNGPFELETLDPSTAESVKACYGEAKFSDPEWMMPDELIHIRNHHMTGKALAHIETARPRILYQMCGNAHVCGSDALGFAPEQSLSALFKAKDLPVLAMPVSMVDQDSCASKKHGLRQEELFFIQGLPEIEFGTGPLMQPQLAEIKCTEAFIEKTKLRSIVGNLESRHLEEADAANELREFFRRYQPKKGSPA